MTLNIPILTKDEFRRLLMDHITHDKKDWSKEEVMQYMIDEGFPKLDFENLNTVLPKIFVYLPTVAVDMGDNRFIWVVSGNNAILVNKEITFGKV